MRAQIIDDTTRSVTVESDVVEFDGIERTIWSIVVRCPVDGVYLATNDYFATREEATEHLNSIFAA